ncbi:unnamed protein product [Owenia fusiformis]|uniref:glycerophosphodiester phosphodiesterase n=1 Tax=Owenia fusiformis TaxID=6347 RepID=A0A8S4N8K2_OWEFU|nr:unnamed protein product [Owenia fusiformis]
MHGFINACNILHTGHVHSEMNMEIVMCIALLCACVDARHHSTRARAGLPRVGHNIAGLEMDRPLIIGHRGSAGMMPEHSLEGYKLAIKQGTDVIECDMCLTKDLKIVCLHESWFSRVTNVKDDPEFRDKIVSREVEGSLINDWFSVDFTLKELKKLRLIQPNSFRDQTHNLKYPMATLTELIDLVKAEDRTVAIHAETKNPEWVNSLDLVKNANTTFEDIVVEVLEARGYDSEYSPFFLQSFSEESLRALAQRTTVPKVMLVWKEGVTQEKLMELSEFCYGMGLWKDLIITGWNDAYGYKNYAWNRTDLVERIHNLGMKVHIYTMRNEDRYLLWDYGQDPRREYEAFLQLGVDGYFTDFPATLKSLLDDAYISSAIPCATLCPPSLSSPGSSSDKNKKQSKSILRSIRALLCSVYCDE